MQFTRHDMSKSLHYRPPPLGLRRRSLAAVAAASIFATGAACIATAAKASELERQGLDQIQIRLAKAPYVPVVVEVLRTTLTQMSQQGDAVANQTQQLAEALLAELADGALREGMYIGGNGLVTLYINQTGLQRLQASKRATWFAPAPEWYHRMPFTRDPASLKRLHEAASAPGGADMVLTLNVEDLSHQFRRDGSLTMQTKDSLAVRALAGALQKTLAHLPTSPAQAALREAERGASPPAQANPATVRMAVGLRELLALSANAAVRDLALAADFEVARTAPVVDVEIADSIKRTGAADVAIQLKRPLPMGRLSAASERAHADSVQRTIDSIKAAARGAPLLHGLPLLEGLYGRVSAEELALLSNDTRIARISAARMDGKPAIDVANAIMNFPLVWGSAVGGSVLRGQGATVVVMDGGMQTDLDHFGSASRQGVNRVTRQRCFSTTGTGLGLVAVTSVCPQPQTPAFDSTAANSGHFTLLTCPYTDAGDCNHGSQVAALAAGQKIALAYWPNWTASKYSGAYEADIWAYTITSRNNSNGRSAYAAQDTGAALSDVIAATTPGTTANKFVVNISYAAECSANLQASADYQLVLNAVALLHARGIPVVASTGNDASRNSLSFPSCVPKVIKVGSVPNRQSFSSIGGDWAYRFTSHQANFADIAQYPGDFIFAVPGGGITFNGDPGPMQSIKQRFRRQAFMTCRCGSAGREGSILSEMPATMALISTMDRRATLTVSAFSTFSDTRLSWTPQQRQALADFRPVHRMLKKSEHGSFGLLSPQTKTEWEMS